ncbi:MAG: hypothetical protein MKZ84_00075 [Dehalococcoidia bacterium]|nr:hypothetical protein [Dehalococcoidia bacterium]
MSQEIESNRPGAGSVIALIVVPSLLSGAGLAFLLVAFLVNNLLVRDFFLIFGAVFLWFDFFFSMAVIRYTLRSLDARVSNIEKQRIFSSSEN